MSFVNEMRNHGFTEEQIELILGLQRELAEAIVEIITTDKEALEYAC